MEYDDINIFLGVKYIGLRMEGAGKDSGLSVQLLYNGECSVQ